MAADLVKLLQLVIDKNASELQLAAGWPPSIRLRGNIRALNLPPLEGRDVLGYLKLIAAPALVERFEKQGTCEFGYAFRDRGHFLVTNSLLEGKPSLRFQLVPRKIRMPSDDEQGR